jgi:hypothetical protein
MCEARPAIEEVLPEWLNSLPPGREIDAVFLDGGANPIEQIEEFKLLADRIKLGGIPMAHDARTRKGKWFVPYVALLDNWETRVFDLSNYGLLHARKIKPPPSASRYTPGWLHRIIYLLLPKKSACKLTIGKD